MEKEFKFVYAEPNAFNNGEYQGFCVEWGCENIGFGEVTFLFDKDGKVSIESEHMCNDQDKTFVHELMEYLINNATVTC